MKEQHLSRFFKDSEDTGRHDVGWEQFPAVT